MVQDEKDIGIKRTVISANFKGMQFSAVGTKSALFHAKLVRTRSYVAFWGAS